MALDKLQNLPELERGHLAVVSNANG